MWQTPDSLCKKAKLSSSINPRYSKLAGPTNLQGGTAYQLYTRGRGGGGGGFCDGQDHVDRH